MFQRLLLPKTRPFSPPKLMVKSLQKGAFFGHLQIILQFPLDFFVKKCYFVLCYRTSEGEYQ